MAKTMNDKFETACKIPKRKSERKRPKRIAIIEDSDDDFLMFKLFFHIDNVIIDRYKNADSLPYKFALNKPDLVIADYYLSVPIKGDEIIKLCDKLRIPSTLLTGYEGDIKGVSKDRIVMKTGDAVCFNILQAWAVRYV